MFLGFSRLAHVYNWSDVEIRNLTASKFNAYLLEANKILADKQLKAFEASVYVHLDKKDKKQIWEFYSSQLVKPKSKQQTVEEKQQQYARLKALGLNRR
jgi:hypothetical protein